MQVITVLDGQVSIARCGEQIVLAKIQEHTPIQGSFETLEQVQRFWEHMKDVDFLPGPEERLGAVYPNFAA